MILICPRCGKLFDQVSNGQTEQYEMCDNCREECSTTTKPAIQQQVEVVEPKWRGRPKAVILLEHLLIGGTFNSMGEEWGMDDSGDLAVKRTRQRGDIIDQVWLHVDTSIKFLVDTANNMSDDDIFLMAVQIAMNRGK